MKDRRYEETLRVVIILISFPDVSIAFLELSIEAQKGGYIRAWLEPKY